jgi:hypothetical protein
MFLPYDNLNHIIIKLKMKKSLLLYAFIYYSLLMNIFTYMFIAKKLIRQSRYEKIRN